MKIVVLYGGVSPEREVSLNSGAAVAKALTEFGYDAVLYDIKSQTEFVKEWPSFKADGVFVALHGGWGEDGGIQSVLEALKIPYTGSGPSASKNSMDKQCAKMLFECESVPAPKGFVASSEDRGSERAEKFLREFGKIIVKPNNGGSTVGVTILTDIVEYDKALTLALETDSEVLVEEFIEGEEATVPVMEKPSGDIIALPAIHIKPKMGFYDYKNKYTSGNTEYICPSDLPEDINERISALAVTAYKALGCRGCSRVDFRVTPAGDVRVLEVNTAPGMTATSLVPKSAK
ncbi:MAG: D-alanine--D-alanine ligase, partial [Synergistes sp.]|nr:D-alanine--D-alanine ligase [Synergistes sp.]